MGAIKTHGRRPAAWRPATPLRDALAWTQDHVLVVLLVLFGCGMAWLFGAILELARGAGAAV